jgi:outer membrane protein assembly factor BamE (lipoprotein component of BamABCDE complex)
MEMSSHTRNFKSQHSQPARALLIEALKPGETLTQGYVVDPQALETVPVGSSREQVLLALGTPSTTATFDNEVFYYISQTRVRPVAFINRRIVNLRFLAVYFGVYGMFFFLG